MAIESSQPNPIPAESVSADPAEQPKGSLPPFMTIVRMVMSSEAFWPGVVAAIGIGLIFLPMFQWLPDLWFGKDGYYSHGPLIPLISGYIIYRRWDKIKDIPVKPGYASLFLIVPLLIVLRAANHAETSFILSTGLIAVLILGAWFVAGWRWALALSPAILFLAFALPIWTMAIDVYTNPLQQLSTKVAFSLLKACGLNPYQQDTTTILLDHFSLNVAVACSGLRLILSITAFTIFFALIANLRWWANLAMAAFVLPLCLFINGLRIAMIGVVGNEWGDDAGHAFHDYSGYVSLVVCFFILFKVARALGWKD